MRFTITREKLQEGLSAVTASIPAKTTLPVLANLLVETTDRGIRLSGTDLDIVEIVDVRCFVASTSLAACCPGNVTAGQFKRKLAAEH